MPELRNVDITDLPYQYKAHFAGVNGDGRACRGDVPFGADQPITDLDGWKTRMAEVVARKTGLTAVIVTHIEVA